jgi:class 3 adenylate cyclase
MATISRRTVLFADLRGSTTLYQTLGNAKATTVVTRAIESLTPLVPLTRGTLIKTLGDGLMATFNDADAAVHCAVQMHDRLDQPIESGQRFTEDEVAQKLQLQIALAAGEVVEVDGDCFGDSVNVAARLLDHAGDNETLVTAEVLRMLPLEVQERFRSLDKVHLRGRTEPVQVHLLSRRGSDTAATLMEGPGDGSPAKGLQLTWQIRSVLFPSANMPVVIGRGAKAGMRVDDARVSRAHARVDAIGGALQLTDLSINGTFVLFSGDDEVLSLRRGTCTLHGSGQIGLGGSPHDDKVASLNFEVLQSGELSARQSSATPAA